MALEATRKNGGIYLYSNQVRYTHAQGQYFTDMRLERGRRRSALLLVILQILLHQRLKEANFLSFWKDNGCAMVIANGEIVAQGSRFSLSDVEVVTATVDIEEVRAYRFAPSRGLQSLQAPTYQRTETNFSFSSDRDDFDSSIAPSSKLKARYHLPEEDIGMGPACWLWDYLRRSKAAGS